jgi:hypothetical protein
MSSVSSVSSVGSRERRSEPTATTAAAKPKVRFISRRRTHRDKHQWAAPWPAAVLRQCINCKAWLVPTQ